MLSPNGISAAWLVFARTAALVDLSILPQVCHAAITRMPVLLVHTGDRERALIIQCVNTHGLNVLPFTILAAQYYLANGNQECNLPADWRLATTDNGWTTNEVGLDYIQHIDHHTVPRTKGIYPPLILVGHESHHSTGLELYCQELTIVDLCMPVHSSHYLQPLDVGCFGPLKQACSRQIEGVMRAHINHASKLEFLCAFREAFFISDTEQNIQGGLSETGVVLDDPQRMLSRLDV